MYHDLTPHSRRLANGDTLLESDGSNLVPDEDDEEQGKPDGGNQDRDDVAPLASFPWDRYQRFTQRSSNPGIERRCKAVRTRRSVPWSIQDLYSQPRRRIDCESGPGVIKHPTPSDRLTVDWSRELDTVRRVFVEDGESTLDDGDGILYDA